MNEDSLRKIPMSSPDITDSEREAVAGVLRTTYLSMGPEIEAFEASVAEYIGARHAVAVNSGTAGLHLCVRAMGVGEGDYVITTPFSFVASANVLLYERAIPIFIDVDVHTGNIDTSQVAEAAHELLEGGSRAEQWLPRKGVQPGGQLKAILPVDVFGQPADYEQLQSVAQEHDLFLLEDSCEAIGARYKDRPAGMFGEAGVFAFYPNKQMTTAEGGVVVSDNDELADMVRAMRNQGRAPGDTWLEHTYLGYNYRLSELSAALGRSQMERLDTLLEKRERVAGWYTKRLEPIDGVEVPQIVESTTRMSWFVYVIRLEEGLDQAEVAQRLAERGVPSRPYFAPIHLQPYFKAQFGYREGDFPVTEDLGSRSLALPFSSVMPEEDVEYVCDVIAEVVT
ncbi:MAG: DegT/DnrJ/EryC1/StrS family aminotransferase [Anaerolineales bacterium]